MRNEEQKVEYQWEQFDVARRPERSELYVSLYAEKGTIAMNGRTYEAFGRPEYVSLMFDPNYEVIGVRAATRLTPGAVKVYAKTNARGIYNINARLFLRHFEITLGYTVRFTDPQIRDGVMILDLHKTARAFNAGKRKKDA